MLGQRNPVLGHVLAVAAPRGKELDEGQALLDRRVEVCCGENGDTVSVGLGLAVGSGG